MVFYFSDKINFETYIESELELNDFTTVLNEKMQQKEARFVNFIGCDKKITININKVLFYTID